MVCGSNKPAQAGTCIMVLLLSFTLLIAPSLSPFDSKKPAETYRPAGVISRTLQSVHSAYGYENVMSQEIGGEEFTPVKARMMDSFSTLAEESEQEEKSNVDVEGFMTMETDMQTIYNRSDLEGEDPGVHDGGRFGRKLHILNDEM